MRDRRPEDATTAPGQFGSAPRLAASLSKHFRNWSSLLCGEAAGQIWLGTSYAVFDITPLDGARDLAAAVGNRWFRLVDRPPHVLFEVRLRHLKWDNRLSTGTFDWAGVQTLFEVFDVWSSARVLEWEVAEGRPGIVVGRTEAAFAVTVDAELLKFARVFARATRFSATNSTAPLRCHNDDGAVVAWIAQVRLGHRDGGVEGGLMARVLDDRG